MHLEIIQLYQGGGEGGGGGSQYIDVCITQFLCWGTYSEGEGA